MKSLGRYISKHLVSFTVFVLSLLLVNVMIFGITFRNALMDDYGETAPPAMLEMAAAASTANGISQEAAERLRQHHIWAIYLDASGKSFWSLDLPESVPEQYTIQDVALFSKGYIADYPVFVWNTDDGLLALGYPQDSYTKLTRNYLSLDTIKTLPLFVTRMLAVDLLLVFLAYFFSKHKIIKNTEPIAAAIETLSDGKPVSLNIHGDLSEVADSVNKASHIISRQNQARANWISGVSHDIRTPLSMIMGYAQRIAKNTDANERVHEEALIIGNQSAKIKDLVQDLNLVSQLEYAMQPLNKKKIRLSALIRTYIADLINGNLSEIYSISFELSPASKNDTLFCDERLIERAIRNLVQNSIHHNPKGCEISLQLDCSETNFMLTIADNGMGLSNERLRELQEIPHYMNSTDDRLDLRHGLGLIIVRQIVAAHNGTFRIESEPRKGYKSIITFPKEET